MSYLLAALGEAIFIFHSVIKRYIKTPTRMFLPYDKKCLWSSRLSVTCSVMTEHQPCPCPVLDFGEHIEESDMVPALKEYPAQGRKQLQ